MKVTNWRKTLATTLAACGMISPVVAARAANLNENLIVNPGFENVDLNMPSIYYGAPRILDWNYVSFPGYAYSHDYSESVSGPVPGFANGGAFATGGHWYFTPGNSGVTSFDNSISQDIDVSEGATATQISGGTAQYTLSGFFSSYSTQGDRAIVLAKFLNATNEEIGSAQIATPSGTQLMNWTQFTATGTVPAAAKTVLIYSWGEVGPGGEGSPDGYQDNLDFRITAPSPAADFDLDGDVDGNDLLKWQRGNGILTGATKMDGDANNSASVNGVDLGIWAGQFPAATAAIGAVPEPTSVMLVGAGLLAAASYPRRERRPR